MVVVTTALQLEAREYASKRTAWMSEEQKAFAEPADVANPPMVLIAAAGSGKTECLVARFEWCMRHCNIGDRLQILSFSNSASHTFQARFEARWGTQPFPVARTLHSWVKHDLLLPHFGYEHRVSMIIEQGLQLLRGPAASKAAATFTQLHLFVDEAQDCDAYQWELLALIRDLGARVAVVGDPRQAIYGFQGARADGMMTLHNPTLHARLTINRRSTQVIVDLANDIATSTMPQCMDTGMESENKHAQKVPLGADLGEYVSVHYVSSLAHPGLKVIWTSIMAAARSHPVCVLTWTNSDAIHLHHGIWLVGYETIAIVSQDENSPQDRPLVDNLRSDSPLPNLIHVRTVHSAKGEGYETVVFHIRGHMSQQEAILDFEQKSKLEQQEELRRYYVACTRAKKKLHVIIQGPVAPLWWDAIAQKSKSLLVDHNYAGYSLSTLNGSSTTPLPSAKYMEVQHLRCRYSATDSLLTNSARSQVKEALTHNARQSVLADSVESLEEVLNPPAIPLALLWLQADSLLTVMRKYIFYFVFAPHSTHLRIAEALMTAAKVPVDTASLSSIESWEELNEKKLVEGLASRLGKYIANPNEEMLESLRMTLDAISKRISHLSVKMPPLCLTKGIIFREYAGQSDTDATYHIGDLWSIARKHTVDYLLVQSDNSDTKQFASLFRRRSILDSKYLSPCRSFLLQASLEIVRDATKMPSSSMLAASGLLCDLVRESGSKRGAGDLARVLPYLGNPSSCVARISLEEDCLGQTGLLDAAFSQAKALQRYILNWHTREEMDRCEIDLKPEYRIDGTACILQGCVPIFVPSFDYPTHRSTSIFFVNRVNVSVEDECEALVTAALLSQGCKHRVVLLEESSALFYIFNVEQDENAAWAATRVWAEERLAEA
uniref:UvrD-like helicase C-terminal domain-containing protein n=1 Tax=viral metagenome TaxID=1070528 RepID=A0A6C0C2W2_9ZZZZ